MLLKIPLDTHLFPQASKYHLPVCSLGMHLKDWTHNLHLGFVEKLQHQCCTVKFSHCSIQVEWTWNYLSSLAYQEVKNANEFNSGHE